MPMLDVEKALQELQTTSMAQVERTTALTWGARAVAAFRLCAQSTDWESRFRFFCDGENYRQEALEHAAMSDDWRSLLPALETEVNEARGAAETAMQFAKPRQGPAAGGAIPHRGARETLD
ncbi:MAG TPA: hypothetical protein VM286_05430 [Candidatus Thermoplasmatota archaeon]|nr:hypothetical protein [Candidatus Thermoplasmatota archaeon]